MINQCNTDLPHQLRLLYYLYLSRRQGKKAFCFSAKCSNQISCLFQCLNQTKIIGIIIVNFIKHLGIKIFYNRNIKAFAKFRCFITVKLYGIYYTVLVKYSIFSLLSFTNTPTAFIPLSKCFLKDLQFFDLYSA